MVLREEAVAVKVERARAMSSPPQLTANPELANGLQFTWLFQQIQLMQSDFETTYELRRKEMYEVINVSCECEPQLHLFAIYYGIQIIQLGPNCIEVGICDS